MAKNLGLTEYHLQELMELPMTTGVSSLKTRLLALSEWNSALRRGVLPSAGDIDWPEEPFRSGFIDVLKKLEMPRFTRRHPKLLASLLKQFLQLVKEFEGELLEQQSKQQQKPNKPPPQQQRQPPTNSNQQENPDDQKQQQQNSEGGGEGNSEQDPSGEPEENSDDKGQPSESTEQGQDITLQLEDMESGGGNENPNDENNEGEPQESQEGFAKELAEKMLKEFEEQWAPAMEALDVATSAFEDIDGLMDGPEGFDSSSAVWHQTGWREVDALRKKLETLRELRELVRSLGRGGGKGPLKKAPEEVYAAGYPLGVIRSEQSPEETRGLTRSGDISRMLPGEAHLLAAGWPRKSAVSGADSDGDDDNEAVLEGGSRACRLLFMARRAERMLMSYERTGWTDDQPSRVTGRLEVRPAAELGPIIVCLDTSGSMQGARETVAKALTLECMRGAHRQRRKCFLYAFSGPGDVMQIELGTDAESMERLLKFLTMSFTGGTDVDAPLALSLERVGREEWTLADILMVTDGEIPRPNEDILNQLERAHNDLGLEVHGLLVGKNITDPMKELCNHLHVFKSWSAVGGSGGDVYQM